MIVLPGRSQVDRAEEGGIRELQTDSSSPLGITSKDDAPPCNSASERVTLEKAKSLSS